MNEATNISRTKALKAISEALEGSAYRPHMLDLIECAWNVRDANEVDDDEERARLERNATIRMCQVVNDLGGKLEKP